MRLVFSMTTIVFASLVGCSTTVPTSVPSHPGPTAEEARCCESARHKPSRNDIVRTAAKLVGATTIQVNGRRIAYDCAGVTRAIFLAHGIDLYDSEWHDSKANGVRLIHNHIRQHGTFHEGPAVQPGDLVFFDNTWDYNGDGIINDPLTHVGIVERQETDGTIVFISRVANAIERYRMNLGLPHVHLSAEGNVLNDYLRRKDRNDPVNASYLTGQLFAGFGTRTGF